MTQTFAARLKSALVGDPDAALVYLGNFEVEHQWATGEIGLPRTGGPSVSNVVNRMDELALLLAGDRDYVVLASAPDADFLDYLSSLGLATPTIVAATASGGAGQTVTEDALAAPAALTVLTAVATNGAYLLPHGVSTVEEDLAGKTGLRLATARAEVCKRVNSKVYSRHVADELGLRQATGWACATLAEFDAAIGHAGEILAAGRRVGVKDAYGVSGKGIAVIDDPRRLDQLRRMVSSMARRRGTDRIGLVVEEWVDKAGDLSYQFTVGRDGTVGFDHVGEAIVNRGIHLGNRLPARLTTRQQDEIRHCAEVIGARLARDGYHGVVGVDAMVDPGGGLYPVTEINARNTMLTYLAALSDRVVTPGLVAMARQYPLRLRAPVRFTDLVSCLDGLLLRGDAPARGTGGVVLNSFATVNADAVPDSSFAGRVYALVAAPSAAALESLDAQVATRLAALTGGQR